MTSSGAVPREIMPGVIWDETAEKMFTDNLKSLMSRKPFSNLGVTPCFDFEKSAIQESIWMVEIKLHQLFIKRRFNEASSCYTPNAKKLLVERWSGLYGRSRTDRLIRMFRNVELKKTVLEKW